jgi:hypothetical protein
MMNVPEVNNATPLINVQTPKVRGNYFSAVIRMIQTHVEHQGNFVPTNHQVDAELGNIVFMILLVMMLSPLMETISVGRIFHLPATAPRHVLLV